MFKKHGLKMNLDKTEVMWVGKQREELNIRLEEIDIMATSWSTNDDITNAHISATIQQILTKFSAVVSYVKQRQIGKFQLICTWVTTSYYNTGESREVKIKINFA